MENYCSHDLKLGGGGNTGSSDEKTLMIQTVLRCNLDILSDTCPTLEKTFSGTLYDSLRGLNDVQCIVTIDLNVVFNQPSFLAP